MGKQYKTPTGDILTLLREIQQLTKNAAECPFRITDPTQLERDLCTLKANVFMLEIKIDHAETLLKGSKHSQKEQLSDSLNTLRKAGTKDIAIQTNTIPVLKPDK